MTEAQLVGLTAGLVVFTVLSLARLFSGEPKE